MGTNASLSSLGYNMIIGLLGQSMRSICCPRLPGSIYRLSPMNLLLLRPLAVFCPVFSSVTD
eukprot:scaffold421302_cov49-Attheya_sp.AAC.2